MSNHIAAATREYGNIPENIPRDIGMSQYQGLFVDQVMPSWAELARAGKLYGANTGAALGLPEINVIPTTTATWGLYNNSATKHLVVLKISAICTTVQGALTFSLIAGLPATPQGTAEVKYANSLALPINTAQADPGGFLTDAVTLAATPIWQTIAVFEGNAATTASLGGGVTAWVNGLYIVPPAFCLGLDVLSSAGDGNQLYDVDFLWAELDMTLG